MDWSPLLFSVRCLPERDVRLIFREDQRGAVRARRHWFSPRKLLTNPAPCRSLERHGAAEAKSCFTPLAEDLFRVVALMRRFGTRLDLYQLRRRARFTFRLAILFARGNGSRRRCPAFACFNGLFPRWRTHALVSGYGVHRLVRRGSVGFLAGSVRLAGNVFRRPLVSVLTTVAFGKLPPFLR